MVVATGIEYHRTSPCLCSDIVHTAVGPLIAEIVVVIGEIYLFCFLATKIGKPIENMR